MEEPVNTEIEKSEDILEEVIVNVEREHAATKDQKVHEIQEPQKECKIYFMQPGPPGWQHQQEQQQQPPQIPPKYYPPPFQQQFFPQQPPDAEEEIERIPYDPETRNVYVRKVLFITFICFLVTAASTSVAYNVLPIYIFFLINGKIIMILSALGCVGVGYAFACSNCSKTQPGNIICLAIFVFFETLVTISVSCHHKTHIILYAFSTTTVIVFFCLCLACSSFDFTRFIIFIYVGALVIMCVGALVLLMMTLFGVKYKPVTIIIMIAATLCMAVCLIVELQMILGGRTVQLSESEPIFAAYLVYSSIMSIFLTMMGLYSAAES